MFVGSNGRAGAQWLSTIINPAVAQLLLFGHRTSPVLRDLSSVSQSQGKSFVELSTQRSSATTTDDKEFEARGHTLKGATAQLPMLINLCISVTKVMMIEFKIRRMREQPREQTTWIWRRQKLERMTTLISVPLADGQRKSAYRNTWDICTRTSIMPAPKFHWRSDVGPRMKWSDQQS